MDELTIPNSGAMHGPKYLWLLVNQQGPGGDPGKKIENIIAEGCRGPGITRQERSIKCGCESKHTPQVATLAYFAGRCAPHRNLDCGQNWRSGH